MLEVEKVDKNNKQQIMDFLKMDVIRHVFALYDLQYDPTHTIMYAALKNNALKGYILIYTALQFPSVILECKTDLVKQLLEYAPENQFILHAPTENLQAIKSKFKDAKTYAQKLFALLLTREDRRTSTVENILDFIRKMPTYGVFINDGLVSYASSFLQLPQVWMIGGVYTHPKHRNKGYATLATSAVTEEALKNADSAALFVRSNNYPAIKVYEKIGYQKIGEKLWVDVGTGLKP
ncbi:MAG: GNAT family N-acetyltransferase [Candidatus Bathyarchaeia archaeon]